LEDEQKDNNKELIPKALQDEFKEYLKRNLKINGENLKHKYMMFKSNTIDKLRESLIQTENVYLDLAYKFIKEKNLEVKPVLYRDLTFEQKENYGEVFAIKDVHDKFFTKNKGPMKDLNTLCTPYPDLKEIIDNIIIWPVRIDKAMGKKFKVYGVQKGERRKRRLFKEHEIKGIDLSRILAPTLIFTIFSGNINLNNMNQVVCKLGVDRSTGKIIVQFYPHIEQEDA